MKLVSIQYARALAALSVVLFHAAARGDGWFLVGAAGVDVFFVISGFIMWVVTERPTEPKSFLAHRVVRIAPLYWIATLAAAVLVHPDMSRLLASFMFVPWTDPHGKVAPVLFQGWTLQYEMAFYVLFALGLSMTRRVQLAFTTAALVGLSSLSLAGPSHNAIFHTYTDPLLLEFLAGIWLAVLWRSAKLTVKAGAPLLAVAVTWFVVVGVMKIDPTPWARLLIWGAPAWMLVAGALALEPLVPETRLGLALGDSSYATYLFHGFITSVVWRLPLGPLLTPVAVVASAVGGWVIFRLLEAPMSRFLRGVVDGGRARRLQPAG